MFEHCIGAPEFSSSLCIRPLVKRIKSRPGNVATVARLAYVCLSVISVCALGPGVGIIAAMSFCHGTSLISFRDLRPLGGRLFCWFFRPISSCIVALEKKKRFVFPRTSASGDQSALALRPDCGAKLKTLRMSYVSNSLNAIARS